MKITLISMIIIIILILYFLFKKYKKLLKEKKNTPTFIPYPKNAKKTEIIASSEIPELSREGYSISVWIWINDVDWKKKELKHIFYRGQYNASMKKCQPCVILNEENNLSVYFELENHKNLKSTIENLPLGRWFNIIITAYKRTFNIFIDGVLKNTDVAEEPLKQNNKSIYITSNDGFSGLISQLKYFPYPITVNKANYIYSLGPTEGLGLLDKFSKIHKYLIKFMDKITFFDKKNKDKDTKKLDLISNDLSKEQLIAFILEKINFAPISEKTTSASTLILQQTLTSTEVDLRNLPKEKLQIIYKDLAILEEQPLEKPTLPQIELSKQEPLPIKLSDGESIPSQQELDEGGTNGKLTRGTLQKGQLSGELPSIKVQPGLSQQPEQPRLSQQPAQPRQLQQPAQPRQLQQPAQPRQLQQPEQPRQLQQPEQPRLSQQSEQPRLSQQPAQPRQLQQPEQSRQLQQSEEPRQLQQSEQPRQLQQPEQPILPQRTLPPSVLVAPGLSTPSTPGLSGLSQQPILPQRPAPGMGVVAPGLSTPSTSGTSGLSQQPTLPQRPAPGMGVVAPGLSTPSTSVQKKIYDSHLDTHTINIFNPSTNDIKPGNYKEGSFTSSKIPFINIELPNKNFEKDNNRRVTVLIGFDRGDGAWWASLTYFRGDQRKYILNFLENNNRVFCFWSDFNSLIMYAVEITKEFLNNLDVDVSNNFKKKIAPKKTNFFIQERDISGTTREIRSEKMKNVLIEINQKMYPDSSDADCFAYIWSGHGVGNGSMLGNNLLKKDSNIWLNDLVNNRRNGRMLDIFDGSTNCREATAEGHAIHSKFFKHILSSSLSRGAPMPIETCATTVGYSAGSPTAPYYFIARVPAFLYINTKKDFTKNYVKLVMGIFLLEGLTIKLEQTNCNLQPQNIHYLYGPDLKIYAQTQNLERYIKEWLKTPLERISYSYRQEAIKFIKENIITVTWNSKEPMAPLLKDYGPPTPFGG